MRDGLINTAEPLVSRAVGLLLVPFLLKGLGAEAYGLWLAAAAVAALAATVDFGLEWSVTREVAAASSAPAREEAARFVAAAGGAFLLLGAAGAAATAVLGVPLSAGLHLGAQNAKIAPAVFALAGVVFFADRLMLFAASVLAGLRRFDAVNKLGAAAALLRAAGLVVLVTGGAGLLAAAVWEAAVALSAGLAAIAVVGRVQPAYLFYPRRFQFKTLRPHIGPGLSASCAAAVGASYWQIPPLLLGMVGGAAWIAPYHIAQKFPLAVLSLSERVASVLFPAASRHARAQDLPRVREVLEVGVRWLAVLALPLCLLLFLLAPNLLLAWLGQAPPSTVHVLRLTAAVVFFDALAGGAIEVLWGCARTWAVLAILSVFAAANFFLGYALLHSNGIAGAAWAMFLTMSACSLTLLILAARACGVDVLELIESTFKGLTLPAAACAAAAWAALGLAPGSWLGLFGAGLSGAAAYAAGLYFLGGRQEERLMIRKLLFWV